MSFIKKLTNERNEEVLVWKIIRQTVETLSNQTIVTLYGFTSDEQKSEYLTAPVSHRTITLDSIFDGKDVIYKELNEATAQQNILDEEGKVTGTETVGKYEFYGALNTEVLEKNENGFVVIPEIVPDLESDPILIIK